MPDLKRHTHPDPTDTEVLEHLLVSHAEDPAGIILRLAWRAGLSRGEIAALTWDRVDFTAGLLRLPDREVPIEPETAETLRCWRARFERYSPRVAVSVKFRKPIAPGAISAAARAALDGAGLRDLCLRDLRRDYKRRNPTRAAARDPEDEMGKDYRLWKLLQAERGTPAGIALWLSGQLGLREGELVRLTWDQLDLDGGTAALPDRTVSLPQGVRRVLEEERARRAPGDDPHVLLTPRSKKPLTPARLSTMVRKTLDRGGLERQTLSSLRKDPGREREQALLLDYAAEHGFINRSRAAALLGVTGPMAYRRLLALADRGALVRVYTKYYPKGAVIPPERQRETVRRYIAEAGPAYRQEIAGLLNIDPRAAARLLKQMAGDGELIRMPRAGCYGLPEQAEEGENREENSYNMIIK